MKDKVAIKDETKQQSKTTKFKSNMEKKCKKNPKRTKQGAGAGTVQDKR